MELVKWKLYVLNLLQSYHTRRLQMELLRYELYHPTKISLQDVIDTMSFDCCRDNGHVEGHISDKTFAVAINYREQARKLNKSNAEGIAKNLWALQQEDKRLWHYVTLLDTEQGKVIKLIYIDKLSDEEIADRMNKSARTVRTVHNKAISNLSDMYSFTSNTYQSEKYRY